MEGGIKRALYDLFGNPWEEYEQTLGWWEAQLEALGITGPEQRRRAPTYLPACVVGSGPPSVTALWSPGYPASGGWQLALGHGGGQP